MPIELYGMDLSGPCRSVALTLDALGIDFEFKKVDLFEGEHMKPEFIKVTA